MNGSEVKVCPMKKNVGLLLVTVNKLVNNSPCTNLSKSCLTVLKFKFFIFGSDLITDKRGIIWERV